MRKLCLATLLLLLFFVPAFAADLVIETIDEGSIHGPGSSIAYDTEGKLHAVFFAKDRHSLKHAVLDEDGWIIQTVYETSQNMFADRAISLALDQDNHPHIACILSDGSYIRNFSKAISAYENIFYAYYDGSQWQNQILGESNDFTSFVSLALDSEGQPHIGYSYYGNVELASRSGENWQIETVASTESATTCYMAIDQNDTLHFSFKTNDPESTLHYIFFNGEGWSEPVSIDNFVYSNHPITIDNATPLISYQDSDGHLKLATISGDEWVYSLIDTADNVGEYSSIETDGDGGIHISYYERYANDLKYAYYNGSNWSTVYVDTNGNVRTVPSCITLDPSGSPVISYVVYPPENDIKLACLDDQKWSIGIIPPEGVPTGYYATISLDSAEHPHMVYSSGNREVYYAYFDGLQWQNMFVASADIIRVGSFERSKKITSGIWSGFGLDGNDIPHIVFPDHDSGDLKYGTLSENEWIFETVSPEDPVSSGREPDVFALESDGTPHLMLSRYFLDPDGDGYTMQYLTKENDIWVKETIRESEYWLNPLAIAIDQNNDPAVCYYEYNWNSDQTAFNYLISDNGSWDVQTILSSDLYLEIYDCDLDFDQEGKPHIAFIRTTEALMAPVSNLESSLSSELELWYGTTSGDQWIVSSLDTVGNLREGSLSINIDLENNPHISYGSGTNEIFMDNGLSQLTETEYTELKYACYDGTTWQTGTLDSGIMPEFGSFSSLTHDSSNRPHVAYFTGTGVNYITVADEPSPPAPGPDNSGCNIASMPSAAILILPLALLILNR